MKKSSYLFLAIFILLLGCEKKKSYTNKVLKLNFEAEPMSLDPRVGTNAMSQSAIRPLFEGLMKIGLNGDPVYGIAKGHTISEDKRTYLFTLRDANWSDGKKVTAYDFEYAWKSVLKSNSKCRVIHLFHFIKNVKKIKEKVLSIDTMGVKAIDDKTLMIELEYPVPICLNLLANPAFSPLREDCDYSSSQNKIISNGPFQIEEYKPNLGIYLIKNKNYYLNDQIKIDAIKISFVKDSLTSMHMFEKREIDYLGNPICKIPFEKEAKFLNEKILNIKDIAGIFWLGFNTEEFPYNNIHYRKALAFSINNKIISQTLNYRKPANTFVPFDLSNMIDTEHWYDINKAKEELTLALSDLNCQLEDLPVIELSFCERISGGSKVAQLIKRQWENNLNLKVKLIEMEFNSYLTALFQHKLSVGGLPWFTFIEDASYHLEAFKLREYPSNWALWENDQYIENLNKATQTHDLLKRRDYLIRAERILNEEMPVVPLYYEDCRYLIQDNIHDIVITKLGEIEFRYCHID